MYIYICKETEKENFRCTSQDTNPLGLSMLLKV